MEQAQAIRELPSMKRNVKLDIKTWNTLRNLKKPHETFNDVILSLLKERTQSIGGDSLKAIRYHRKVLFIETEYRNELIGIEYEYNDIKNEPSNFTLDLQIKKVFWRKRMFNPSVFFGVDHLHKHFNLIFLDLYLVGVASALRRELRIQEVYISDVEELESLAHWRKIYYEHSLSEDSFIGDIEEPLRLSEDEKMDNKVRESIKRSLSNAIWNLITLPKSGKKQSEL